MIERLLGEAVVVCGHVVLERRLQLLGGLEACLADDLADAAVESLDHAVGLRMTWRAQAVLDGERCAALVEGVLATGRLRLAGEAIGELTAVWAAAGSVLVVQGGELRQWAGVTVHGGYSVQ